MKDKHKKIVTNDYAREQKKVYRKKTGTVKPKPKEKRRKITCKCDVVCKGVYNFKRHVRHMHSLNNWMKQIKEIDDSRDATPKVVRLRS